MNQLAMAYAKCIRDRYGCYVKNMPGADEKAMKISKLGIDFDTYVELAVTFGHSLAEAKGWKYPYWGAVTSDWMIGNVAKYLDLQPGEVDLDGYECEMLYVMQWMRWYLHGGIKPKRVVEVGSDVKREVARNICLGYGIEYVPSYIAIAKEIGKHE